MHQPRNFIALFWVSLTLSLGFAWWWYGMLFLKAISIALLIWFITGIASLIFELSAIPADASVLKRLRISGQIFRGISAATAALLLIVVLVSIFQENAG
jgi:hypothetical protein